MKKCIRRKLLSLLNVFTLVFTIVFASLIGTGTAKAEAGSFMLYVYYEGTETLYMDIWNWSGISFAEGATVEDAFGWNKDEGVLQASDYENLYVIPVEIKDSTANDGFDVYAGNSSTKVATYDSQWNNTADYTVLMSGASSEYVVKQGTVFTSLKDAGYETSGDTETGDAEAKASVEEILDASEVVFSEKNILVNGDFENSAEGWTVVDSLENTAKADEWASNNKSVWFTTNNNGNTDSDFSLSQTVTNAEPGIYKLTIENEGATSESGLSICVNEITKSLTKTTGWDSWTKTEVVFEVAKTVDLTVSVAGPIKAGYWGAIDNIILTKEKTDDNDEEETVVTPVDADVTVERVAGVDDDFITGADVSSYLSVINSGAKFYDENGKELNEQGFFNLLAAGGTNYIRIRVWNDPYDSDGNGYGGGNNDLETAKVIGQYATNAGMKVLIDFHYSDFWADPGKQQAPKAWASMSVDEKAAAISEYTTTSLKYLLDNGVDVGMVQVGNETTNSMTGVSFSSATADCCKLFDAGCDAVHKVAEDYNTEILAAIHFTNPERAGNYNTFAKRLADNNVSYDVFASSYYPYWHGTLSNLTSVLKNVADTYGVKVMVAETSWANTLEDGDGHENTVKSGNNDKNNSENFDFSVQGQCTEIREVANAVANVGAAGIGLFYWENAWIPVQNVNNADGTVDSDKVASNKLAWEKYGSGWASSYAGSYDAKDAGKWYGGSAVDNQAWFDFDGKALATVNVYNYIRTGSVAPAEFSGIEVDDIEVELAQASSVVLPTTLTAKYSDGTSKSVEVIFDNEQLVAAVTAGVGEYKISGIAAVDGEDVAVELTLVINPDNLLTNGGFENGLNDWTISSAILNTKDAASNFKTGTGCLHFYTGTAGDEATATQTVSLKHGKYKLEGFVQGGGSSESDIITISATVGDKTYTSNNGSLTGWKVWDELVTEEFEVKKTTDVTVTVTISNLTSGVWGAFDDLKLIQIEKTECVANEEEILEEVVSTCTVAGHKTVATYCDMCGEKLSEETKELALAAHVEKERVTKEPGVGVAGEKEIYCENCGTIIRTETIAPTAQKPSQIVVKPVVAKVVKAVKTVVNVLKKLFGFR